MKGIKTIAWLTVILWAIQSLTFLMFFASSFTHLIVRCFVTLGMPISETSVQTFLSSVMKLLSWPVRPLLWSTWSEGSFITIILLLALNSLIWAGALGALIFLLRKGKNKAGINEEGRKVGS